MSGYVDLGLQGVALAKPDSISNLRKIEAIIFDCDGVLIDTTESYDRAIQNSAAYLTSSIMGTSIDPQIFDLDLIYRLRSTGLYNNDWDTAFTLITCFLACLDAETSHRVMDVLRQGRPLKFQLANSRVGKISPTKFRSMIEDLASKIERSGSPEIYRNLRVEVQAELLDLLIGHLRYPTYPQNSLLTMVFDEYFYGSESASAKYGRRPVVGGQKGLILNERPLVDRQTLDRLTSRVGKGRLGLATGRDRDGTSKTLGDMMDYFNPDASCFIMDEIQSGKAVHEVGKPGPYSLLKAAEPFQNAWIMYVGDSMEDLIMFSNAVTNRGRMLFAGICGPGPAGVLKMEKFRSKGADLIVGNIQQLPEVLEKLS